MLELKIVLYLLIFTLICYMIVLREYTKSSYNWKGFTNHTDIGAIWIILRFAWIGYFTVRWIIYPFTCWFLIFKYYEYKGI